MGSLFSLLIPILAPVVTSGIKKVLGMSDKKLPPNMTPLICAGAGALLALGGGYVDPSMAVSMDVGAVSGLAGTGLHQILNAGKYKKG